MLMERWQDSYPEDEFPYDHHEAMIELECHMQIRSMTMPEGFGSTKEDM